MASPATAFGSITETDVRRGVPVTSVAAAAAALQLPVAEVLEFRAGEGVQQGRFAGIGLTGNHDLHAVA